MAISKPWKKGEHHEERRYRIYTKNITVPAGGWTYQQQYYRFMTEFKTFLQSLPSDKFLVATSLFGITNPTTNVFTCGSSASSNLTVTLDTTIFSLPQGTTNLSIYKRTYNLTTEAQNKNHIGNMYVAYNGSCGTSLIDALQAAEAGETKQVRVGYFLLD